MVCRNCNHGEYLLILLFKCEILRHKINPRPCPFWSIKTVFKWVFGESLFQFPAWIFKQYWQHFNYYLKVYKLNHLFHIKMCKQMCGYIANWLVLFISPISSSARQGQRCWEEAKLLQCTYCTSSASEIITVYILQWSTNTHTHAHPPAGTHTHPHTGTPHARARARTHTETQTNKYAKRYKGLLENASRYVLLSRQNVFLLRPFYGNV